MCTAIGLQGRHFMFGRNLDLEYGFHERVTQGGARQPSAFCGPCRPSAPPTRCWAWRRKTAASPLRRSSQRAGPVCGGAVFSAQRPHARGGGYAQRGKGCRRKSRSGRGYTGRGRGGGRKSRSGRPRRRPHEMVAALLARLRGYTAGARLFAGRGRGGGRKKPQRQGIYRARKGRRQKEPQR